MARIQPGAIVYVRRKGKYSQWYKVKHRVAQRKPAYVCVCVDQDLKEYGEEVILPVATIGRVFKKSALQQTTKAIALPAILITEEQNGAAHTATVVNIPTKPAIVGRGFSKEQARARAIAESCRVIARMIDLEKNPPTNFHQWFQSHVTNTPG